jgi:hypothetical protein
LGEPLRFIKKTATASQLRFFYFARVGLSAPSPSPLRGSVVPLLSLSQIAPMVRARFAGENMKYEI